MKAGLPILLCASSYKDHSECCKNAGVGEDDATKNCLSFCNPNGGMPQMDMMEAYQCLAKFDEIKNCFQKRFSEEENE